MSKNVQMHIPGRLNCCTQKSSAGAVRAAFPFHRTNKIKGTIQILKRYTHTYLVDQFRRVML